MLYFGEPSLVAIPSALAAAWSLVLYTGFRVNVSVETQFLLGILSVTLGTDQYNSSDKDRVDVTLVEIKRLNFVYAFITIIDSIERFTTTLVINLAKD